MPRVVKPEEQQARRDEILAAALKALVTHGYQRMTVQHVLDSLGWSKGALYHYFDAKQQLVEALLERMAAQAEQRLAATLAVPSTSALESFCRYFEASHAWKVDSRELVLSVLRLWSDEANAFVRQRLGSESLRGARLLEPVIRRGVREGVFTTRFPREAAQMVVGLGLALTDTLAPLVLAPTPGRSALAEGRRALEAYVDGVERLLGAPTGSLPRLKRAQFDGWLAALQPKPRPRRATRRPRRQSP